MLQNFPDQLPHNSNPPRALCSPAVQRSSCKADISYPHLTLSPPLSPSHEHHLGQATRVQQLVPTSHVDTFLKRHALDEKLAVSLGLLEHIPAPSWHQVVRSLDIAETQRAGLMEALMKDWTVLDTPPPSPIRVRAFRAFCSESYQILSRVLVNS